MAADDAPDGAGQLGGGDDLVGAEAAGFALLVRVAGTDHDGRRGHVADEAGDGGQAHRARPEDGDHRLARRRPAAAFERGVDAAGERLDEHGPLVGDVVADAVQLGLVGHQLGRPAAARGTAEPGLDAGVERTGGEVGVVVAVAGCGTLERRREAVGLVAEHRFEHDAGAVVELADDLVAGHEREAHPVVEVGRRVALDHRQVGPADPGQPGAHAVPARAGQLGRVDVGVLQRPHPHGGRRRQRRRHPASPSRDIDRRTCSALTLECSSPTECLRGGLAAETRMPKRSAGRPHS